MTKNATYTTMQLIADILSFKDNRDQLASHIQQTSINWDGIVVIGSKHLMLPALYCRLKAKHLLDLIPEDLTIYLEEITSINRGRNEILLQEAHQVSELFNKQHIEHVFIKGMALLGGHVFEDPAERMIGDIDILIAPNQIHEAFNLLENHGYTDKVSFNYEPKKFRHLSRQIDPNKIGAVELHSEVLVHKYRTLIDIQLLLKNKRKVNGINVPAIEDTIRIAIFSTQINDNGHLFGFLSFKTIYDGLSLGLQNNIILLNKLSIQKQSQSFLELSGVFFTELQPLRSSKYSKLLKMYFCFKLKNPRIGRFARRTIYFFHTYWQRLKLLVGNKSYRNHILKNKIINRKKIFQKPNA